MRRLTVAVLAACVLSGCGGADEETARDLARQSCEYPAPKTPNFDPDTAPLSLLVELDQAAAARSDLAAQAAGLDARWQPLSDAASALAAYSGRLREIRSDRGVVSEQTTPAMWDQVKMASDAFILECRGTALP